MTTDKTERVVAYHQRTKHRFDRFARGPRTLDWATQPDPFRRYVGAELLPLAQIPSGNSPPYESAFSPGHLSPAPLDRRSVSQLLFDSLAISAWKRAGDVTWALRVNPSSGNLHPTEGYLICGEVPGLTGTPAVCHYAPREHALEVRARVPLAAWQGLTADLPAGTILIGLTSIHWREAWKYGERAFRYCQHDVGHALAAISLAAAGQGWQAALLDGLGTEQLAQLLGVIDSHGVEPEHPDCLLAIYPQGAVLSGLALPEQTVAGFPDLSWKGRPSLLSQGHVDWPVIDDVAEATAEPPASDSGYHLASETTGASGFPETAAAPRRTSLSLWQIIRQRRSAVAMDGQGTLALDAFYQMLGKTLAKPGQFPFSILTWRPAVHLLLFVHRVEGLAPGLYFLVRDAEETAGLQSAMKKAFAWKRPPSCPLNLDLYELAVGDVRMVARQLCCQQAIASDGCFSLGMLAAFEGRLRRFGPWF
jgi:SagB-type dehydrogenase family enzyme